MAKMTSNPFLGEQAETYLSLQKDLEDKVHLINGQSATVIKFLYEQDLLNRINIFRAYYNYEAIKN